MRLTIISILLFATSLFAQAGFLMPEEAFKPSVTLQNKSHLKATVVLGEAIYLYKDKLSLTITAPEGIVLEKVQMPTGEAHDGEIVFTSSPGIFASLAKKNEQIKADIVSVKIAFQGCSEQGLCYEPMEETFKLAVDSSNIPLQGALENVKNSQNIKTASPVMVSEIDQITQTFIEGNVGLVLLTFFGFGLLLSLTPCIFPMIPILSSIIVSQGEGMNAKRGFLLSLVYVLAMSVAYTLAGVLAGLFGSNIQVAMQNPWVISTFALLFVGLAVSMFGFFEIGLPASWQSRLAKTSDSAGSKGGYAGVAVMGFLSALIVGPCVAPPLAGALMYIGQTGDALLGGAALFVLSIGMGLPLLLIGTGAGRFMPHPGGWMQTVSKVFGVIMLSIAIYMLSRIVPPILTMYLWAVLLVVSGVYMGALEPLKDRSWDALFKGVGLIALIYGFMLFYGALKGETNPFDPLPRQIVENSQSVGQNSLEFKKIHSLSELDAVIEQNKGKKIMLDFYADWCVSCKELEHTTFKNPDVIALLKDYVLIQADVTQNSDEERALSRHFGLFGPPGIIFFDKEGKQVQGADLIGYKDAEAFLKHIKKFR